MIAVKSLPESKTLLDKPSSGRQIPKAFPVAKASPRWSSARHPSAGADASGLTMNYLAGKAVAVNEEQSALSSAGPEKDVR
jgi:hypothetical protein